MYFAVKLGNKANIRSFSGVTDNEWMLGVRMYPDSYASIGLMQINLEHQGFTILDNEKWQDYIYNDEPKEPSHKMKSTYVQKDKWDRERKIY
jgi:hypothetical protein